MTMAWIPSQRRQGDQHVASSVESLPPVLLLQVLQSERFAALPGRNCGLRGTNPRNPLHFDIPDVQLTF